MTADDRDDLVPLLRPLREQTWEAGLHRDQLRARIEATPRARSRWTTLAWAAAGGAFAAVLLAATGGARFLQELFGLEIVDVQRDAAGNVERITVRPDDATPLQLQPLEEGHEFEKAVVVMVPRRDGGELRVGVWRDNGLDLLPTFVSVNDRPGNDRTVSDDADARVRPGARFTVREVPCPWRVVSCGESLVLAAASGDRRIELPRLPVTKGALPRYGDARGLVEILDP